MNENSLSEKLKPQYQNPGEETIAGMLDSYDILFFYKQPTIVMHEGRNKIWTPSFTLPQYGCGVVDYLENADQSILENTINIYRYNQIPATVLGPKDLYKPNIAEDLYIRIIEDIIRRTQSPTWYHLKDNT